MNSKLEYFTLTVNTKTLSSLGVNETMDQSLGRLGAEGWELVSMVNWDREAVMFAFKRHK